MLRIERRLMFMVIVIKFWDISPPTPPIIKIVQNHRQKLSIVNWEVLLVNLTIRMSVKAVAVAVAVVLCNSKVQT